MVQSKMQSIRIKYHNPDLKKVEQIDIGNWIDLRCAEKIVTMFKGDARLISLGVSMELPYGFEAHVVPRSSTFKSFGIIQWNHFGVIDNLYCGNNDVWKFTALAMRDTVIQLNDRICQFRIMPIQPKISFIEVENLENKDRGGFGSTGKN